MKHTPGPWKIKFDFNVFQLKTGRLVASCGGHSSNVNPQEIHYENLANTRLVAAAPDLLEACQTIANMDESRKGGLILDGKYAAAFITIAKQAIAKATKEDT